MKNKFLTLLAITALIFTACKKDDNAPSNQVGEYQPVTVGSTWSYRNTSLNPFEPSVIEVDTTVNTMTAEMKQIGALNYHKLTSKTNGETIDGFLGYSNDVYTFRFENLEDEVAFDLPYLNDKVAAGGQFITALKKVGEIESQFLTTIEEKGAIKNILNKNYSNVIHSKVEVQIKQAGQWKTQLVFHFHTAKNVGIIQIVGSAGEDELLRTELFSYSIK